MDSLRDIGYELPAAVADLIDNSLSADATRVDVTVTFEGETSWIRVADNGTGMTAERLNEAMRYGTDREYNDLDLGKFGLGMKTASLSQCRTLTVATRTNPDRREIEIREWDLDYVMERDAWELQRLSTSECRPELLEPLQQTTGTVVMWSHLDRVLRYKLPSGQAAETGLATLCREIEFHLAMVFHRFLSGEARRSLPLTITVNGNAVEAWDPFAPREAATQRLPKQALQLHHNGRTHTIAVQPYVLPHKVQFSTTKAWEVASGPKSWNRQQGFYIYRAGRLIQSGGWNRLRTSDEHTKLARVAIDIPRAADTAFEINVSKMRVIVPAEIRNELKAIATAVTAKAQSVYRQREGPGPRPRPAAAADGRGAEPPGPTWGPDVPTNTTILSSTGGNHANRPVGAAAPDLRAVIRELLVAVITEVLVKELGDQPQLLQRVLAAVDVAVSEQLGDAAIP